ncbi:bifunctional proline dehydrogenase/L-glutamate gamma-semialdehyde dehydrogenase PutA [Sphingomonas sp. RP10(2022)]|uniref:Bifunctional protein PutA n=1 Tax=Sphingomonas liriopis TaxID=2949094 RepID=A0A9X2HPE5_9SPHN|nr:bifunctional proline dehydrogenase/L-glutamate gamma-semialdehyde dehydrogenase PutA [Sphingomonas liriopis]MCP3733937.1 bifunctional proline dehydrogenase/L-glutamate gamma-semialdehyde dehydrogenase PutA [Sphingomonas liriopis]
MLRTFDWDRLDTAKYQDEAESVGALLRAVPLSDAEREAVSAQAVTLVQAARTSTKKQGVVESFLQEYSLGTKEGLALMCLAEAMLRTPDAETRDRLIAEKIGAADWGSHLGGSDSLFVNASTWGLMLTGKLIDVDAEAKTDLGGWFRRLTARLGEPVIRQAVGAAVKMMGEQFVLGRTIEGGLERARKEGYLCSFDMLGEGARTAADAARYESIYANAIEAVGAARAPGLSPEDGHGVSVKLSALCPRYEAVQEARVWEELYPRVKRLALIAARHNLNFAIDAEEADRLVISLRLVDRLAREEELGDWTGLGVVVQAYQKRGLAVIEGLAALARSTGRRIMVRLVKGAYWDSEIKRAQVAGRPDYPVFTTKPATDLSYLVCAAALIEASPALYPQFATHNAHTLAAVSLMATRRGVRIEHQRLHGMGEALYKAAGGNLSLRAYAPVGGHEELLPYLVRRLLENGANTSFVHALLDERVPAELVVSDPVDTVRAQPDRHPRIPTPADLYGATRANPPGRDYSRDSERAAAARTAQVGAADTIAAGPIVGGQLLAGTGPQPVHSPVDRSRLIGTVAEATPADIDRAATLARAAQPRWDAAGGVARGRVLRAMGDALEGAMDPLIALLSREAGKTLNDGVAEVREAVDFCRYYAHLAETQFNGLQPLPGPVGETNHLELRGRGTFVCISPWNFPLAIFTGQIAAALAAGNAVLAKPAEQTPLVAAEAVRLFHAAGLDPDLLALLPGDGATVGAALVAHPGIAGVAFTGGTDTAWGINRSLAERRGPILPFIAETGGLNAMFVDTTALKEQVVDDVIVSAIGSAGQRCSALRLLFVPEESADELIATLTGALDTLVIGDPADAATDVGPVIDADALAMLEAHRARLEREAMVLARRDPGVWSDRGYFFGPVIAEVPRADFLAQEVFGPILHIYRYKADELEGIARQLADTGYGLTLGIHSRIEGFANRVRALVPAGNVYVNRSIIGAVVGVQPFGGEGLSGTGPKAGGPHALLRYSVERAVSVNITAQGGDPALLNI